MVDTKIHCSSVCIEMIEIIAEIGINHNGNMGLAKNMIWSAKGNGADVAKFQIYDPVRVLDATHPLLIKHWDTILKTELTRDQVIMLKEECDKADIEFLASVFRPEVVEWTEAIGMKRYKIASRSIYDKELAETIAATGKPIIMSWGYHNTQQGLPVFLDPRHKGSWTRTKHLYCISKYPTALSDLDFNEYTFRGRYDGFSDHTEGIIASIVAMSLGAKIIEKHVTYDKTLDGPDHACSITFDELWQLCRMRDQIDEILS